MNPNKYINTCILLYVKNIIYRRNRPFLAVHFPNNSSNILLRSRCCLFGVCAALALVFINLLPLIERSLRTTAQAVAPTAAEDGAGAPDAFASSADGHPFAREHNAETGESLLDSVAVSAPPNYEAGALDENANEKQMTHETLRWTTPSAALSAGTLSESRRLISASGEQIISVAVTLIYPNDSRGEVGEITSENEGLNSLLEKVGVIIVHYSYFVQFKVLIF